MSIADFAEDHFELMPGEPLRLYAYQREFLENEDQFRLILKARQVGMSSVIAWEALAHALLYRHQTILFVSASQRQATELLNYVKRVLSNLRLKRPVKTLQETQQTVVVADTMSRIISLPNSPNTIQGLRAHLIYIDEYAIMDNDRQILEAILPSISHGGRVVILSRPYGKRGEFYRLVHEARRNKNQFTLFEVPYTRIPDERIRKNIEQFRDILDPLSFSESYMCEFVDEGKSYFPYELQLPCVDDELSPPRPTMDLVFGVDFGKVRNSTVITIVEERGDYHYVRKIKEFVGVLYSSQLNWLSDRIEELGPKEVRVDEYGVGVKLFEDLRNKHGSIIIPVKFDNRNKNEMIATLRIAFEDKKIRIPRNDVLISQLHALQKKIERGYIKWEPGRTEDYGKHDDYVWSLAMAVSKKTVPQLKYFKMGETKKKDRIFGRGVAMPFMRRDDLDDEDDY